MIASDHGTLLPPRASLYDSAIEKAELSSHIDFVLAGGLVERALAATSSTRLTVDHAVSQADIAPLFAWLLDVDGIAFMADNPLTTHRRLPVLADLGDDHVPETQRLFSRRYPWRRRQPPLGRRPARAPLLPRLPADQRRSRR